MMVTVLLAALAAQCAPIPGVDLLADRSERFVIVGEMHGTDDTPRAFGEMVCHAATARPVTVALELPTAMQTQIDAFMSAASREEAEAALERTPFTNPEASDGRTSLAKLDLLHRLRDLKAADVDIQVSAFQPLWGSSRGLSQTYYELQMAAELGQAAARNADAKIYVLVGNVHAAKTPLPQFDLVPAAAVLPPADVLSIAVVMQGGEAWNCQQECGVHPIPERYDQAARGLVIEPYGDGRFDGVLALGPATASPPAGQAASIDQPPVPPTT